MTENKKEEKKKEEKSEEEILFPEVKVGSFVVKPWAFGKLFELSPSLELVLDKMGEKGISIDNLFQSEIIKYSTLARLFTIASSEVLKIIATTLDKTEEEIKDLDMADGIKIVTIIFKQNREVIKNALSPSQK